MAKAWAFYPHPSGKKIRGLDISAGVVYWAACRSHDTRTESIFLPGPKADAEFKVENSKVVQVSYGLIPIMGYYPVQIKSIGAGTSWICATRGKETCFMDATVYPQLAMHLSFKAVETEKWKSTFNAEKMQRLVDNCNFIYSYQGNINVSAVSTPSKVTIAGLPNIVKTDDIDKWGKYRDKGADTTVFFVKDNDALGVSWSDLIIMEDSQKKPWDEMTFAHELGHRMGLPHPSPKLPSNLMNQTKVGDRNRMRIYLNRDQIETVTDKSKWNVRDSGGADADVCEMPR